MSDEDFVEYLFEAWDKTAEDSVDMVIPFTNEHIVWIFRMPELLIDLWENETGDWYDD